MSSLPLFWDKRYVDSFEQSSILLSSYPHNQNIFEINTSDLNQDSSSFTFFLSGQILNYEFNSSIISTFGGVYTSNKDKIDTFIINSLEYLSKNYRIQLFKFRLPPEHLMNFNQRTQIQTLLNLGFKISLMEINYAIELKSWTLNSMSKGNVKKFNQCVQDNLIFKKLDSDSLSAIYNLLESNRRNLGTHLSLDLSKLSILLKTFPDKYFLFGIFSHDRLIATSICVETFPTNLYVFYWGDDANFRHYSPVTFLAKGIIDFAMSRSYDYLDLGTVGPNGDYIVNLARYKQNLGATFSFKYCLELNRIP